MVLCKSFVAADAEVLAGGQHRRRLLHALACAKSFYCGCTGRV